MVGLEKKNHIVNFSLINLFEIRFQIIKKKIKFLGRFLA